MTTSTQNSLPIDEEPKNKVSIALMGCGFVADYYLATIDKFPHLVIEGAFDIDKSRLKQFCEFYQLKAYASAEELLTDEKVSIVLNLTDPRSHYKVSKQILEANKHVYSEKPLAMRVEDAEDLVKMAKEKRLRISSAPCSVLGKASQTLAHAVKQKTVGNVKLVYAELEDGLVHKMAYKKWYSLSGAPWPYRDEFEVGCTLEHAGYYLAWLINMFGSVKTVTAFSDCRVPEKVHPEPELQPANTADISIGILKFESGVVVRLSTSIIAPHDHSIRIFGDKGVLYLDECWDNDAKVYCRKLMRIRRKTFLTPWKKTMKLPQDVHVNKVDRGNTKMDFLLGVNELAQAVSENKSNRLNEDFSLHVTEVSLALQYAGTNSNTYTVRSRC